MLSVLLAQLPPAPEGVESWLKVFFWLVAGCGGCVYLFQQLTGRGLKEVHGRIKRERAEIDANVKRVEDNAQLKFVSIENELKENTRLTASMDGTLKALSGTMSGLSNSFTTFLQNQASKK